MFQFKQANHSISIISLSLSLPLPQSHCLVAVTFQSSRNFDWTCSPKSSAFASSASCSYGKVKSGPGLRSISPRSLISRTIFSPSDIPFSIFLDPFGLIKYGASNLPRVVPFIPPCSHSCSHKRTSPIKYHRRYSLPSCTCVYSWCPEVNYDAKPVSHLALQLTSGHNLGPPGCVTGAGLLN